MKRLLILQLGIVLICACHSNTKDQSGNSKSQPDTAKKNFLPVLDYLKAEIAAVDSFPQRIMRYHSEGNKTDSGIITTQDFDKLAREFLLQDLDSSYFENHFEENSFVDRSTNLVSFTYSTKDTGNGLKRVDVLLSPGAGVEKLNSIYMETLSAGNDSILIRKMSWKAGRNFRILRIIKPGNKTEKSEQTAVVWDDRD
jgi:hypothetical protein